MQLLSRLPGFGPRSARRATLQLLKRRELLMLPLATAIQAAARDVLSCSVCGNYDDHDPCYICRDYSRDRSAICVVEDVADLWAMERSGSFHGIYHVLGGTLSALDGIRPEDLRIDALRERVGQEQISEVILALDATMEGQTTAHYIADILTADGVTVSRLAYGLPMGGELESLDDGTLSAAFGSRRAVS